MIQMWLWVLVWSKNPKLCLPLCFIYLYIWTFWILFVFHVIWEQFYTSIMYRLAVADLEGKWISVWMSFFFYETVFQQLKVQKWFLNPLMLSCACVCFLSKSSQVISSHQRWRESDGDMKGWIRPMWGYGFVFSTAPPLSLCISLHLHG